MSRESVMQYLLRKSFIFYLVVIESSFIFISYPQNFDPSYSIPVFEYISIENGLPDYGVTCIFQDYLGYLWLGTQNGLVKYDGYSLKVFQTDKNNPGSLSNTEIVEIFEDADKTLWIGTMNGLNKFNRADESFKCYKYNPDDTNSINWSQVHSIYEDKAGRFWIGTLEGLNLFERDKEIFRRYYFTALDSLPRKTFKPGNNLPINAIIEDPVSGNLLIGTSVDGLWNFNIERKTLSKYKFNSQNNSDKKIGWIQSFYKSRDEKIWMASFHTLSSLDPEKKELRSYIDFPIISELRYPKPIFKCASVIEDGNGLIWTGFTIGDKGAFCLNPKSGFLQQYNLYPDMPENSKYNNIFRLYKDNSGIIWIGSWGGGLIKYDKRKLKFKLFNTNPKGTHNLSPLFTHSVFYDNKGSTWFVTSNALIKYDLNTFKLKYYFKNEEYNTYNINGAILGKSGDIWISTEKNGLIRFNPVNESYSFYLNDYKDSMNLINKNIRCLFQDHLGLIWIGTRGFGLYKYDITKNKLNNYKHYPGSLHYVLVIFEDRFGTVWIGANQGGLNKFDRNTEKFIHYGLLCVTEIFEDKKRNLWVADYFSGLNLFDREKGKIIASYNQKDGLSYNAIAGILEDDHNNLWIGTQNGLSKFPIEKRTFKNYYKEDGIPDNQFMRSACCKGVDGTMYFSTEAGLVVFHPDSIKDDPIPPKVVISKISLFNKPNEKLNYKGFISELNEITLPYDQNDLRLDFVGLHFSLPEKNKYRYILENFDNDWIDAGTQRNATYTNLDPGKYLFRVEAANKDGIWNETGASIIIIITSPWWETTYAYILYALFIICIIYLTWRLQLKRIRVKHEFEMSKFEAEKLHEVDELKSRFFTNISHEFRTPLTLILGPVKQIIEESKDNKIRNKLRVVHKNAKSLLGLVNELLDISKLESGNMKLQASRQNIIPLLKALMQSFCSYAEGKRINLKFNSTKDEIIAYIDKEKFEKIITNILSNAFKFTPEGGEIEVTTSSKPSAHPRIQKEEKCHFEGDLSEILRGDREIFSRRKISPPTAIIKDILGRGRNDNDTSPTLRAGVVEISIRDTGTGIPREKIQKIFDRFYQVDGSHTREHEGTGIGLSLTKELVELHKGKIEVVSEEGKGTTFTIRLPLDKVHLNLEEISEVDKDESRYIPKKSINIDEDDLLNGTAEKPDLDLISDISTNSKEKPILLIVEDNSDVRNYVKNNLDKDYKIFEAADGEDGWDKSVENMPDLIISDVMMPKLDGFQLCEKLKTDERTSHIPIILLTAKASSQDKIEGFETGADEYLMKPFETDELRARIKNLIEQRKRIHEHFKKHGLFEIEEKKLTPVDKKFLQKVFDIISGHISDTSFNVETLVKNLSISRSVLHRKIISLTGEPPGEIIKRIKLKKAASLIEQNFGNFSEIALEVGFNNPAYFSECFKKQYGMSPSEYQQKFNKN